MRALATIFFSLAGACLAYFLAIVGYSGISTSFCWIWLLFMLLFIVMGVFIVRSSGRRLRDEMPRFAPAFVFTTFGLAVTLFTLIMGMVVRESRRSVEQIPDYCIVMGARVYPDGISRTLMYRLDRAIALFEEDRDTTFIVAGGQERGDAVPEALAMYNYMVMKGMPSDHLLIQPAYTTTSSIIASSLRLIQADTDRRKTPKGPGDAVWAEDYVPSVGIITSDYHLLRAVRVAEEQGVEDPVPIAAPSDPVLFVHQCVRESLTFVRDLLMGEFTIDEQYMPFDQSRHMHKQ